MKDVFIRLIDGVVVGSVGEQIRPDDTAYLNRFGVRLSCHNIGIGKSLMNLADKLLMSRDVKSVYLHTASKYFGLVRFYYNRGLYIDSVTKDRGYASALMVKEYN